MLFVLRIHIFGLKQFRHLMTWFVQQMYLVLDKTKF